MSERGQILDILADVCVAVQDHDYGKLPSGIDLGVFADRLTALRATDGEGETLRLHVLALRVLVSRVPMTDDRVERLQEWWGEMKGLMDATSPEWGLTDEEMSRSLTFYDENRDVEVMKMTPRVPDGGASPDQGKPGKRSLERTKSCAPGTTPLPTLSGGSQWVGSRRRIYASMRR